MSRPVAISLSPNTEKEDTLQAFSLLFQPMRYLKGRSIFHLEEWFYNFFKVCSAISFNSGRSALYAVLKTLDIQKDDEVLLQAFTCVAVPNAVLWAGAKPVYVDISKSLTMDVSDLQKKVTKKTKAIIVQHTFGIPNQMEKILEIARFYNLRVIEDCAHVIGAEYHGKKLGTMSDAAIFSFGRDKAISSVFGGMAITNNQDLGEKLRTYQKSLSYPKISWVAQQLFHPVAFFFILMFYQSGFGKLLLVLFQKLNFLSFPVTPAEKKSKSSALNVLKMPNALSFLALLQLKKLGEFNKKRGAFGKLYIEQLQNFEMPYQKIVPFLRFPLFVKNRDALLTDFRKKNIYLGKWYSEIIDPKGVDLKMVNYEMGSCKKAEEYAGAIINLPTYPLMSMEQAKEIIQILKSYGNSSRN